MRLHPAECEKPYEIRLSLSKNAYQARAEMGVLEYKREKNEKNAKKREGWISLHFLFANFLRFMAANLSLTQLETWARPAVGLSRILCKRNRNI